MQLQHGDNLGNGFCTSTRAKPIPEIVPMLKLDKLYIGIHLLSSLGNLHLVSIYVYYIRPNITFLSETQNRNSGKTGEKIVLLHGI